MNTKSDGTGGTSRRNFMRTSAAGMAAVLTANNFIFGASATRRLKIALLGCGGRGNGALDNCIEAGKNVYGLELEVVAMADWFRPKAEQTGARYSVPASRCFGGADAYRNRGLSTCLPVSVSTR